MRRPPVAAVVFGVGLAIALVVPIIAFALFARATIESDVSAHGGPYVTTWSGSGRSLW